MRAWRPAITTAAVLLACWPVWEAAGWLVGLAGLAVLDLPIRAGALLLLLAVVEALGADRS